MKKPQPFWFERLPLVSRDDPPFGPFGLFEHPLERPGWTGGTGRSQRESQCSSKVN